MKKENPGAAGLREWDNYYSQFSRIMENEAVKNSCNGAQPGYSRNDDSKKGKHCEFIGLGDGISAIACGVPDKCDHDSEGGWYCLLRSRITGEETWIRKENMPSLPEDIEVWLNSIDSAMIGGSSSCSKCGRLAIDCMDINLI
ncbi:MAG: hypothetical protein LBC40_00885 [Dysgonamonadaceae bacterium]|jgi:hypothetical protein|nr:hypothetical protein [Dysgonamonadaceae bacterium]